ncbi:sugar ABC transporter permease [Phototrophicus methaneseepsis]|uniref:Sugar ABC transporter permease n=1 Tax=Phototrophicus methaneseepsis TaxID=2710758 RepID=A0A7S8IG03_9CHLR|nr:sugar ABC transporter permease [Phototrophicus methaneseepsis]QPC84029.1 sugar ABC transporter permease [Phototrophicus methaneseepsis]
MASTQTTQGGEQSPPYGHDTDTNERSRRRALAANLTAYSFLAPAGILVVLFFFIPMILVVLMSMTNLATDNFTTNIAEWQFVGLRQYQTLANDPFASKVFFNTIFYVLCTLSIFNISMALVVSLLTAHIPRKAGFFFRAMWMLPRITSSVIYIMMWERIVADVPFGILNWFNTLAGQAPVDYSSDHTWVLVILVNGFVGVSFGMIIFTSAIESIPKDIMNASLVDGSTIMQRIRYVILPSLRWPLLFVITYQTLSLLTSFEQILLLTNGGPSNRTEVWALAAYHRALSNYFGNTQWGYGAAFSVVLVVIGVALAFIYMRVFRFNELVSEPKIEVL